MREVQASDAKTHLPRLLDDVEGGETLVITRHGKAIARLVPEADVRREEIVRAFADMRAIAARSGGMTVEEILAARHEGHRY
jgi:hypothetical protein